MIFFDAHALFEYTFTKNGKKKIEEVVKNLFLKPDNRTSMVRPCIINLHLYLKKKHLHWKQEYYGHQFYVHINSLSNNIRRFMVKGRNWVLRCRFTLLNQHIFSLTNRPLKRCIYAYDNEVWHFSTEKTIWSELMVCCTGRGRLRLTKNVCFMLLT